MIDYKVLATGEEKEAYRAAITDLFQRAFARPLTDIDWQHFIINAPYEGGRCVVAVDDERVVGTANLVPQRLTINDGMLEYYLFTTSMVDLDYRKKGVYMDTTRLAIETARKADKSFILAFPNEVALRPLTMLFPFKRLADLPIVSGALGELSAVQSGRSVQLDEAFIRWRFEHRPYFWVASGNRVLICKEYGGGLDIAEVLVDPPASLRAGLPERRIQLGAMNALSTRCPTPGAHTVLTTLHATVCRLRKDIDLSSMDVSLLMWDVV